MLHYINIAIYAVGLSFITCVILLSAMHAVPAMLHRYYAPKRIHVRHAKRYLRAMQQRRS